MKTKPHFWKPAAVAVLATLVMTACSSATASSAPDSAAADVGAAVTQTTPPTETAAAPTATALPAPETATPLPEAEPVAEIPTPAVEPGKLYNGLPQGVTEEGFPYLGQPEAPVTIIDYSDFL